jgi:hypothetical protein
MLLGVLSDFFPLRFPNQHFVHIYHLLTYHANHIFPHLIITMGIPTIRKGNIRSPFICNMLHWSVASTVYPSIPLCTFKLQRSRNAWQTLYITQEDLAPRISSRDWSHSAARRNGKTAWEGKTGLWPHESKRLNKPSQNLSNIIWTQYTHSVWANYKSKQRLIKTFPTIKILDLTGSDYGV